MLYSPMKVEDENMRCFASLSTLLYTNDMAGSLVKKEVGKRGKELVYARVLWYL